MTTYYIQMDKNSGWNLHRVAGITTHFTTLRAARYLMEDGKTKLIVLDKEGYRLH